MVNFPANRDIISYLEIKPRNNHTLISVAGGLGFLHLITPDTKKIYLIDRTNMQIQYAELVIELIKISETIYDFLSYVSCQAINIRPVLDDECLTGEKIDRSTEVENKCGGRIARMYRDWMLPERKNVLFFNGWRQYGEFAWWFGQQWGFSNLRGERSFCEMRDVLRVISVDYIHSNLEDVDYGLLQNTKTKTYVYVSNAENRFYTPKDKIYHQIIQTILPDTYIILTSWYRQIVISSEQHHADAIRKILPWTKNEEVFETTTYAGFNFSEKEIGAALLQHKHIKDEDRGLDKVRDFGVFLYHISLMRLNGNFDLLKDWLQDVSMKFKRVIIFDRIGHLNDWFTLMQEINFHWSYETVHLDYSGGKSGFDRNFIMVLEIRGFRPWRYRQL